MNFVGLVLLGACGGFTAGFVLACIMAGAGSTELWEVTTLDGEKRWFTNVDDVNDYMRGRGLVAVRKLRALT